jgi:hypothetical protein
MHCFPHHPHTPAGHSAVGGAWCLWRMWGGAMSGLQSVRACVFAGFSVCVILMSADTSALLAHLFQVCVPEGRCQCYGAIIGDHTPVPIMHVGTLLRSYLCHIVTAKAAAPLAQIRASSCAHHSSHVRTCLSFTSPVILVCLIPSLSSHHNIHFGFNQRRQAHSTMHTGAHRRNQ